MTGFGIGDVDVHILLPQREFVVILKYKTFPGEGNLKTSKANYIFPNKNAFLIDRKIVPSDRLERSNGAIKIPSIMFDCCHCSYF